MRMIVFFDLPVTTAKERKAATQFRNFLLKDGYHMVQYSVYSRVCNGVDAVNKHEARLNLHLPDNGSVRLLVLTEKQYESIRILLGERTPDDNGEPAKLTSFF
ncbi:MAG: CRISPR-associated endonuclease Cas2 [Lachnospiraceae bacterium]